MDELDANAAIFSVGGAAAAELRRKHWSKTSLGATTTWPKALVAHVRAMLATRQPTTLCWGPELLTLYNDAFIPILGDKHPTAFGLPACDCWREAWSFLEPLFAQVLAGTSLIHDEVPVPVARRRGLVETAWWKYSYSPLFDDDGTIAGVLVVSDETTRAVKTRRRLAAAQREADSARKELHGIFMQAPLPMCILTGKNHRFTLANRHYLRLVDRAVLGRTVSEAFTPEEVADYLPVLDRVFATGEPFLAKESPLRLTNASGGVDERVVNVGYHPHRDSTGAVVGVLVVIVDVTLEVAAKKQLESDAAAQSIGRVHADALRREAEAANRAKDEFLATVSHELRTPLTAILGWSRMLLDEEMGAARMKKGLAVIERNARIQAKLVDDILDVSRIISGKLRLAVRGVELDKVVANVVDSLRPAADAKGVRVRIEGGGPPSLLGDEDRLQQVVWNLVANAVKFTPEGGSVVVRTTTEKKAVRIEVSDTGRGITPSFLPHVFDRFRQHDASTTKEHAGLGLGLAIVRHLVELHGGTVSAHSEGEDRGATFEVVLPVRDAEAAPLVSTRSIAADTLPPPAARDVLHDVRLLVVDDQPDAREVVALVLEEAGAIVLQAGSTRAATDLLATSDVAAIISDIGMPDEDGYAFLQRVRSAPRTRDIPALALTAYARVEERERALASGFQDHLAKPVEPATLVANVAALVGR